MTVTALTPTWCHHLGDEDVILELLLNEEEDRHEESGLGETAKAARIAGIAASSWTDDGNHLAERGDESQHVKVRHAEQVQPDAPRRCADRAGQNQLPFSHALTLVEISRETSRTRDRSRMGKSRANAANSESLSTSR